MVVTEKRTEESPLRDGRKCMERNVKGRTDTATDAVGHHPGRRTHKETVQHLLDLSVVVLLDARWWLSQFRGKVEQTWPVAQSTQLTSCDARVGAKNTLDRCGLEESLQHTTRATVLETLVRGEAVLGAVATVAELAHVQRIRLLVFVLEVALQRVVAGEGAMAIGTFLWLVYSPASWRRHPERLSPVELVALRVAI